MSQQNGGGWGPPQGPGWGGAPQAGGYGPPPGAPGGGYGPPPGGGYGPPGAPPPGGGYGPPGAPPGGYGPPGAPPGGYGPPGAPPGGGYGPPGAPQGYGPPPGGGYGAPPPGGGFGPGGDGPRMGGGRVAFSGDGLELFKVYLMYAVGPMLGTYVVVASIIGVGVLIEQQARTQGVVAIIAMALGVLILIPALIAIMSFFAHKFTEFKVRNLRIDGQACEYRGTTGGLAKLMFVNLLLTQITFGIYGPWAYVNFKKYTYANTLVNGQPGRLTFTGNPGDLLGKYIIGYLLTMCTAGIYVFWFLNDMFAFEWENTQLDGRPFRFNRDPGGLFGALILNYIITLCTGGLYSPWMLCNLLKWESERVS